MKTFDIGLPVKDGIFIASETDENGIITKVNNEFLAITGYTRDELIGKPHNIIRHPDMPSAAFAEMWRTIKAGKKWSGIVKNRAKDGSHYWVYANVSPIMDLTGKSKYTSIRQACTVIEAKEAEELYKTMDSKVKTDFDEYMKGFDLSDISDVFSDLPIDKDIIIED